MTAFEVYVERLAAKRREEREQAINEELLKSLREKTGEEVLAELFSCLFFRVQTSDKAHTKAKVLERA